MKFRTRGVGVVMLTLMGCSSNGGGADGVASDSGAGSDAARSEDAGADDASVPLVRCTSSLASACNADASPDLCPPPLESDLPGPWCATHPRAGAILGACAGYALLREGVGVDGLLDFLYAPDGGALVAVVSQSNIFAVTCLGGSSDFVMPESCFIGNGAGDTSLFNGAGAAEGCATDAGTAEGGD